MENIGTNQNRNSIQLIITGDKKIFNVFLFFLKHTLKYEHVTLHIQILCVSPDSNVSDSVPLSFRKVWQLETSLFNFFQFNIWLF